MMDVPRGTSPQEILRSFDVSRETTEALRIYVDLLLQWNRTINLVGRSDEKFVWSRHVADALQLMPHISSPIQEGRAVDLGSGAGLPGLVLAIATGLNFHLIEADQRKAAFLREAARATKAPVTVHATRIEAVTLDPSPLITARALASLPDLLTLAAPLLAPGGVCLFPKGGNVERELTAARAEWHMKVEQLPSQIGPRGIILRISEVARA